MTIGKLFSIKTFLEYFSIYTHYSGLNIRHIFKIISRLYARLSFKKSYLNLNSQIKQKFTVNFLSPCLN